MACCLVFLLVALNEYGASTLQHVFALAVQVGPVNALGASYGHAVVRLGAAAAVVP